jgi:hypothetical protein
MDTACSPKIGRWYSRGTGDSNDVEVHVEHLRRKLAAVRGFGHRPVG